MEPQNTLNHTLNTSRVSFFLLGRERRRFIIFGCRLGFALMLLLKIFTVEKLFRQFCSFGDLNSQIMTPYNLSKNQSDRTVQPGTT